MGRATLLHKLSLPANPFARRTQAFLDQRFRALRFVRVGLEMAAHMCCF
jgi:hypothetical protein